MKKLLLAIIVFAICVLASDCLADTERVYIAAGSDDAIVYSQSGFNWDSACPGSVQGIAANGTYLYCGARKRPTPLWNVYEVVLRFDVPVIPGTITAASVNFYVYNKGLTNIGVGLYLMERSDAPSTAYYQDWVLAGSLTESVAWTSIANNSYNTLTVPADSVAAHQGEYMSVMLVANNDVWCAEPTGGNFVQMRSKEANGVDDDTETAKLNITYTPTPTERPIFGPIVSHEPTANPMVKVSPVR